MPLFSERNSKKAKQVFKTKENMSLDDDARTKIWNCFYKNVEVSFRSIASHYWEYVLIQPVNYTPYYRREDEIITDTSAVLMRWIAVEEWRKVFDLIEIASLKAGHSYARDYFVEAINQSL